MKSIEILEREHTWIAWMTRALEALLARAEADGILPEAAYELLALYESFADGRHQDKEERVLLPELLSLAGDEERALLGRILADHEAERARMASMRAHILGAVHGEPLCVREFVRDATAYLELHRGHMARESQGLFPLAERLFDRDSDERVVSGFEEIEPAGDPHAVREQILGLYGRLGLPRPAAA